MPRRLVVGNWKMNGDQAANAQLLRALSGVGDSGGQVVVCVPFPYLFQARQMLEGSRVAWGAQDVSAHRQGAFTGEVAAAMLTEFGCTHVIVGHSERRQYHGESSGLVAQKAETALGGGLVPIVCIGETLAEREAGRTVDVVLAQLDAVSSRLDGDIDRVVVAYEPVWAIGTGRVASPEQAREAHRTIRVTLDRVFGGECGEEVAILYGGSVNAGNAAALFAEEDLDGALVGGASLEAASFWKIAVAAASR